MGRNMVNKAKIPSISFKINDEIEPEGNAVRIVGDDIESKIISWDEAKKLSEKMEKDLILISNKVTPWIIRLDEYSKYLYEQKKKLKQTKQKTSTLKEVQLSTTISSNDLSIKAKKAKEFIEDGDKVKVVLTMRGRELGRREESKKSIYKFIDMMSDVAIPEAKLKDEGNRAIVILKKK